MQGMEYFYELFSGLPRGGPGNNETTRKAFSFIKNLNSKPLILDIGCGPGMQTIELAKISKGNIIALDNYQPFLDKLMEAAKSEGVDDQITIKNQSMLNMDFENNSFDVVWSEGALYFMGVEKGLKKSYQLLKNKGYLAFSEAVYLSSNLPETVIEFWEKEYADIKDIEGNIEMIKNSGFELIAHFTLSKSSWFDNFYTPMEKRIQRLNKKYSDNKIALDVFDACKKEIEFYKKFSDYFGYEFFILHKA